MKKSALILILVSSFAIAQTKKVIASELHWWAYKIAKTASSSHDGTLNLKSGSLVLKNNEIVGGKFEITMNSLNSVDLQGEDQTHLNDHLKSEDFFNVKKFPTAVFVITSTKKNDNPIYNYMVTGKLTIKGKTNAILFPAKIDVRKGIVSLVSNKFSFDRQKFDLSYSSSMKDVLIKDEIDMQVKISAK